MNTELGDLTTSFEDNILLTEWKKRIGTPDADG